MGAWVFDGGKGTFEKCQFVNNARVGIGIRSASPVLTNCKIANSGSNGMSIYGTASPSISDCEIARSKGPDVAVWGSAEPVFNNCHIHTSNQCSLLVRGGSPVVDGCAIDHSPLGVQVDGGSPQIRDSKLSNIPIAVRWAAGEGSLTGCSFEDCAQPLEIADGASPTVSDLSGVPEQG
jgi:hypothetical protein